MCRFFFCECRWSFGGFVSHLVFIERFVYSYVIYVHQPLVEA